MQLMGSNPPPGAHYPAQPMGPNPSPGAGGPPGRAGDPYDRVRNAPMFPLSAASDRPYHLGTINKAAYKTTKVMKLYKSVVTRWAAPGNELQRVVVVDVYQLLNPFSMGTSPFQVQANLDCQLVLGGRFQVRCRPGTGYSKHWTRQHIEQVGMVVNGTVVPFTMIERREERVAPEESEEVKNRFRSWSVPV